MKNILSLLIAVLLLHCTPGVPAEAESPDIAVQVEGAPQGMAYLIAIMADQNYQLDSAVIDPGGKMIFQRDEPYPAGLLFLLLPDQSFLQVMVDKDQTFKMTTKVGDFINAMQVEGSLDNELLYQSLKFETDIQAQMEQIARQLSGTAQGDPENQKFKERQDQLLAERRDYLQAIFDKHPNTLFTAFKKAGQNPEVRDVRLPDGSVDVRRQLYLYRTAFWDDVDFNDERLLRTPVIFNKLNRYITELTPQAPDSINQAAAFLLEKVFDHPEYYKFFANWIARKYEPTKTSLMDSEAVFVFMVENYFTNERAFWSDSAQVYALQLRAHEMKASLIGKKAPDVKANDPGGTPRAISDIRSPYVIVYLYNPTCDHCIEETPKLVDFYRQWKGKGLEVYAIAIDTDQEEWQDFIARNKMDWINVFDPTNRAIYATYFVDVTPEIYVLNPDRVIIGKNLKVDQIAEVIERDKDGEN